MTFVTEGFQKKVSKPWGEETIFTPSELKQAGKIIRVKAGQRLSLQFHETKEETLCLLTGEAILHLENAEGVLQPIRMQPELGYTVQIKQKHRLEAVTDCVVVEVSSPETGTTVRLEDDYQRGDETESQRQER